MDRYALFRKKKKRVQECPVPLGRRRAGKGPRTSPKIIWERLEHKQLAKKKLNKKICNTFLRRRRRKRVTLPALNLSPSYEGISNGGKGRGKMCISSPPKVIAMHP